MQCHFTPLFWSSAEGRCCEYPQRVSYSLLVSGFAATGRFRCLLFFSWYPKCTVALRSETGNAGREQSANTTVKSLSAHLSGAVSFKSSGALSGAQRAARERICIQRLSVGEVKRPHSLNWYLLNGPQTNWCRLDLCNETRIRTWTRSAGGPQQRVDSHAA